MRRLVISALFFMQVLAFAEPQISIRSFLSSDDISTVDFVTNTVVVAIKMDADAGFLTNDLRCVYPGDPVYKGLTTVSARFSENLLLENGLLHEKQYRITWVFSPQYAGSVVLKPLTILLIHKKKTNTVLTPVKTVQIREPGSTLLIWIIIGILGTFMLVGVLYIKRKKGSAESGTETSGGSDGK